MAISIIGLIVGIMICIGSVALFISAYDDALASFWFVVSIAFIVFFSLMINAHDDRTNAAKISSVRTDILGDLTDKDFSVANLEYDPAKPRIAYFKTTIDDISYKCKASRVNGTWIVRDKLNCDRIEKIPEGISAEDLKHG